jgi:carboxypeptidase family protein
LFRRTLAIACATAIAAVVLSAQPPPPQPPAGTGLIAGKVVDAATGRAIGDVAVTPVLVKDMRPGANANARAILSDAEGRFVLRGLPAGSYQLFARRAGYVEDLNDGSAPGADSKPIALGEGGRFGDATIRLWKLAVIAGRVIDDSGEPIIGLQVRALKRTLVAGRWKFGEYYSEQKYGSRTDDRGVYRISDLMPGEYVVSVPLTALVAPASVVAELEALRNDPASRAAYTAASERFAGSGLPVNALGTSRGVAVGDFLLYLAAPAVAPIARGPGDWLTYQTQFHPGVPTASFAQPITVKAGEERDGIDFALKPVRTWRVSGTVTGPTGPGEGLVMRLAQDDSAVLHDTDVAATVSGPNGVFTFLGVSPGRYIARVMRVGQLPRMTTQVGSIVRTEQAIGSSPDPTLWATMPVIVGDGDVSGVEVRLSTGVRATGRLVFDGKSATPTAAQLASFEIAIEFADGRRPSRYGDDRMRPAGDTFVTPELAPGKYLIRTGRVGSWKMKSAVSGNRDISDVPLVVDGREIPTMTITMTDRSGASIAGIVRPGDAGTNATVFMFPVERDAWLDYGNTPRRLRSVRATQDGAYAITDVPPGDYFIAASTDDQFEDWRDPKHLDAVSRAATRITIADEEAKAVDLTARRVRVPSAIGSHVTPAESAPGPAGPFVSEEEHQQQPARDLSRALPEPTGTAAMTGVVVSDDATAGPVRRVVVTLNSTEPRVGRTGVTDDAGRFAFSGLPAGRYSVFATKPGYIDSRFGATKPGRPGTPISLATGEQSTITIRIMKGAVISGVVRDARGEPFRGVAVNVSQYRLTNGERRLSQAGRAAERTDDRGQYRIFGLEPGEYFVSIEPPIVGVYRSLRQTTAEDLATAKENPRLTSVGSTASPAAAADSSHPDMGYAPVFYPGTPLFSRALPVSVAAGEERAGVDISIALVALARIRAHVVRPDGQPPAMVQARLTPLIQLPGLSLVGLDAGMFLPVSDGNVQITGVPPGEYALHVGSSNVPPPPPASRGGFSYNPTGSLNLPMWAIVPLTIDGRNIDDLNVTLELGKQMKGRVVFEGSAPAPAGAAVQVFLRGPQRAGVTFSQSSSANPAFSFDGIVPAAYRVTTGAVRGWMLKSAIVNGRDASDLPVEINADVGDAVITFTDKLTELSGFLQTPAGMPATNYFVIVFPRDPTYWLDGSRRIVSLRPASDGRFATTAANPLPPGDYLIAAVTDVASGEWYDPEFLKQLTAGGIPITIGEGEKKRQDIQIRGEILTR